MEQVVELTGCRLTVRSSGPRGQALVFPEVVSARGRSTRRYATGSMK